MPAPPIDFLIAGVQKGGTTALYDTLRGAPGLSLSSVKELHFFDDEAVDWNAPDYDAYHRHWQQSVPGLRGEATPIYLYWPQSLERAAAYNPGLRLILIFRDPVERAWSHWRMETERGAEDQPFGWAIREGRGRVTEATDPKGAHRVFSYVERGFYGAQLSHVLTLFPRRQILLLRSEDLAAEPDETVDRVCGFLDVAPPSGPVPRLASNVGVSARLDPVDANYLGRLYRSDLEQFASLSGLDVTSWAQISRLTDADH